MSHKINFFAAKKGQEDIAKTLFEAFSKPYCIRIKQYNREEQIGKPVYQFEDLLPENVYKDFLTIKDPKIKIPAPIYVTDSTLLSKIILSKLYKSDAELFIDSNKSPLIEYSPSFFIKDNTLYWGRIAYFGPEILSLYQTYLSIKKAIQKISKFIKPHIYLTKDVVESKIKYSFLGMDGYKIEVDY